MIEIYYNSSCSKCRMAKESLKDEKVKIIEYLKEGLTKQELKYLLRKLRMESFKIVRTKEKLFKEKFSGKEYSNKEWIDILVKNPSLIQRPIIVKGDKAVIGRSEEAIEEIKKA